MPGVVFHWRFFKEKDKLKPVIKIQRKIVVNERGEPQAAIIPWKQFCEIAEALGFDLDEAARTDLRAARRDFQQGKDKAFVSFADV